MTTRRDVIAGIPTMGAAFSIAGVLATEAGPARAQTPPLAGHFHPKGKAPSPHTVEAIRRSSKGLPFHDTRDFEEQERGLIAERPMRQIMADAGNVAFDRAEYDFLDTGEDFDSVHPSMARIARLNNNFGLYEVIPGIYQVRGFDLSDMTLRARRDRLDRLRSAYDCRDLSRGLGAL